MKKWTLKAESSTRGSLVSEDGGNLFDKLSVAKATLILETNKVPKLILECPMIGRNSNIVDFELLAEQIGVKLIPFEPESLITTEGDPLA